MRSFFLSVFSMFASRSLLGQRSTAGEDSRATRTPYKPRLSAPAASGKAWRILAWSIAAGVLVVVPLLLILDQPPLDMSAVPALDKNPRHDFEGLLISDLDVIASSLQLASRQLAKLEQALDAADKEYLELELAHTSRKVDAAGKVITVNIAQFASAVEDLEQRVHSKVDAVLNGMMFSESSVGGRGGWWQKDVARNMFPQSGQLFAFGYADASVEMWQVGGWYYWKASRSSRATRPPMAMQVVEGNGAELPRRYKRFWQGGPAQAQADKR